MVSKMVRRMARLSLTALEIRSPPPTRAAHPCAHREVVDQPAARSEGAAQAAELRGGVGGGLLRHLAPFRRRAPRAGCFGALDAGWTRRALRRRTTQAAPVIADAADDAGARGAARRGGSLVPATQPQIQPPPDGGALTRGGEPSVAPRVRKLLAAGANVQAKDAHSCTALPRRMHPARTRSRGSSSAPAPTWTSAAPTAGRKPTTRRRSSLRRRGRRRHRAAAQRGADADAKDADGQPPLQTAREAEAPARTVGLLAAAAAAATVDEVARARRADAAVAARLQLQARLEAARRKRGGAGRGGAAER